MDPLLSGLPSHLVPQSTAEASWSHLVDLHWLSILCLVVIVYVCQSQSSNSSRPFPPLLSYLCSLCLCFCFVNKIIWGSVLNTGFSFGQDRRSRLSILSQAYGCRQVAQALGALLAYLPNEDCILSLPPCLLFPLSSFHKNLLTTSCQTPRGYKTK